MRAPGDILLLSTYELGHQPLHLASPLGFLEAAGFSPRAIDLAVERLDEEAVARAKLIAVAVPMHTALRLALKAAARCRDINTNAHLCFYGLYAPLNRELLLHDGNSSVIGGEYESELLALCERLEGGRSPSVREVVLDRLTFAPPSRRALPPLERYARLLSPSGERPAGYVEASRGCLHLCRHCPIPPVYGGRFFVVPRELVLDDLERQLAAGARHITFGDPDFLNGPRHALELARALNARHPEVSFDATIKVEHILEHAALFPELARLGCVFVVSAVETLDDRVLELLDKGHTRAGADRALAIVRAAGITLRPSLVPFTPWSTLEGYGELLDWIETRELVDAIDPIHLAIRLLIPPGSKLLELAETREVIGPLAPDHLTYVWKHADARMDALQAAVLATVESAARAKEDPRDTFSRVRALYRAALQGRPLDALPAAGNAHAPPVRLPRLSEAWFC